MRVFVCHPAHVATFVSFCSYIIITNLQPLSINYVHFHTLSVGHLSMLNDAGNIRIIIYFVRQESNVGKIQCGPREIVL